MSFSGLILTNAGRNELAKAELGEKFNITHIAFGDGNYNGTITNIKELVSPIMELPVAKTERNSDKVIVECDFKSADVPQAFYFREIGIIANGKLCYYDNSREDAEYIDPQSGHIVKQKRMRFVLLISSEINISATIDSSLYALEEDLQSEIIRATTAEAELQSAKHTHGNKKLLDNISVVNNTADKDKIVAGVAVDGGEASPASSLPRPVWITSSASGVLTEKRTYSSDFTYVPSTHTLNVKNVNGTAASATNADMVDGKHASDLQNYNNLTNKPTIPAAVAVKGNAESSYRTGNINLTAENIGALPLSGGTMNNDSIVHINKSFTIPGFSTTFKQNVRFGADYIEYYANETKDTSAPIHTKVDSEGIYVESEDGPDGVDISWSGVNVWNWENSRCSIDSAGIRFLDGSTGFIGRIGGANENEIYVQLDMSRYWFTNECFSNTDNGYADLGASNYRWNNIYATNGVIQTSDRTKKYDIENLDDDKTKEFIMGLTPVSYKMTEGTSGRTHYGLIAQDVEELMSELGMDSKDFAGFIKSPKVIRKDTDEDGNPLKESIEEVVEGEYDYGLRHNEFIAPLIKTVQSQQREIEELKKELKYIKEQLL